MFENDFNFKKKKNLIIIFIVIIISNNKTFNLILNYKI